MMEYLGIAALVVVLVVGYGLVLAAAIALVLHWWRDRRMRRRYRPLPRRKARP